MSNVSQKWGPGSFTKNYSWGPASAGLSRLHEAIRVGFDNKVERVPRQVFRARLSPTYEPDYIVTNFFLFNSIREGVDTIEPDELVFQAVAYEYNHRFDQLALFAFNLSIVGIWKGAKKGQIRPALWANQYIRRRFGPILNWDASRASADDIQHFLASSPEYSGKTSRKVATNLAYIYKVGDIGVLAKDSVERWWIDALFLTIDRVELLRSQRGATGQLISLDQSLKTSDFWELGGKQSLAKTLAARHLVALYETCGGLKRFSIDEVNRKTAELLPDEVFAPPNDPRPRGAVHVTNPAIQKSIPPACSLLAALVAGFEVLTPDAFENFSVTDFIVSMTQRGKSQLAELGIRPSMSPEQLMRLTRDE